MKVYISADIEGITGVTHWDETEHGKEGYEVARAQMTAEVAAACEGALQSGATEVWVRDAHGSARNILPLVCPARSGWCRMERTPVSDVAGTGCQLPGTGLIGYHSRMGSGANPLSHTMSGRITWIKLNGVQVSEFSCALTRSPGQGAAGFCLW